MHHMQFYPSDQLAKLLEEDARRCGLSTSALVVERLNTHYGLSTGDTKSEQLRLSQQILNELQDYVANPASPPEFTILKAAPSYKKLPLIEAGASNPARARVGRVFARLVGQPGGPFERVAALRKANNEVVKDVNGSTIYRIERSVPAPIDTL